MRYWKLGCRWGAKRDGFPLFLDILQKHHIVISWEDKDYGIQTPVLLTDGHTAIGYAITTSQAKTLDNYPNVKQDLFDKKVSLDYGLRIYDAKIELIPEDLQFNYSLVQGICEIQQRDTIIQFQNIIDKTNQMNQLKKSIQLLQYKKQIILQGPPGTGKTREAKMIALEILGFENEKMLENNDQFKIIQFHPSYTYEDFVRGIVAESKGDKIDYKNVNKTLGEFAEIALKNYKASKVDGIDNNLDSWIDTHFELFKEDIKAQLPENEILLSGDITLYDVTENSFRYGKNWKTSSHILFGEFKNLIRAIIKNELELSNKQMDKDKFRHAHYRYTYYNALLEKFFKENKFESNGELIKEKKYVLVIDEINRANLSSVLGELIYALEYRNNSVHSMYGIKDENNNINTEIILPENLYIIGTMNTADRSVGHIDYAIRRRFAFVDVLPEKLEDNDEIFFNTSDFIEVAKLFIKVREDQVVDFQKAENSDFLLDDFSAKDVALGHSYFIADKKKITDDNKQEYFNMKMKYEVIPILNEYLKDGVFNEKATVKLKEIEQRFA